MFCATNMQIMEQFQGLKTDWCTNSDVSVRHIFEDNHNWDVFYYPNFAR